MASDPSSVRPTKAVVIRAFTDILRGVIKGTRVLELFAGTGRVGRRLLEEGADSVVGVDFRDPPADLPETYEWLQRDVMDYVEHSPARSYDIVYMDPPYDSDYAAELLPEIASGGFLNQNAIVAVETDYKTELPSDEPIADSLYLMRRRDYGGTRLWVYQADREAPGYRE